MLIHGLFGSLENLGALARILAQDFTVYSIDLPNHGRSPHVDNADLGLMSELVLAWMSQQGLSAVGMVGHSLGGKVSMEIALLQPAMIERLVVMDIAPSEYSPHHNDVFKALLTVDIDAIKSRSEADEVMQPFVPEVAVRSFLLKNILRKADGGFAWKMNLTGLFESYENLIRANVSGPVFAGETLFLKGGASDYIGEKNRQDIVSRFPSSHLKIVANTGHWLHAEKPQVVAKLIANFLLPSAQN